MKFFSHALCAMTLLFCGLEFAQAGMTINGTRVVYPADQREVSLGMNNNGKEARLVQVWVDAGDAGERPENSTAPFVITPPMARVDPGKGQTLRIMFTGADLPQDRETVFWLNVLEIPPKPKAAADTGMNYMQLAVRSRMKIFYRPTGLLGTPDQAVGQLNWRIVQSKQGHEAECTNPTPFNVSFSDIRFKNSAQELSVSKGGMCPAMGTARLPLTGEPDATGRLVVTVINDWGGFNEHEVDYTR